MTTKQTEEDRRYRHAGRPQMGRTRGAVRVRSGRCRCSLGGVAWRRQQNKWGRAAPTAGPVAQQEVLPDEHDQSYGRRHGRRAPSPHRSDPGVRPSERRGVTGSGDSRSGRGGPVAERGRRVMAAKIEPTRTHGVYKRGNRYVVRYRDTTGEQRQRSVRTFAEARSLKARLQADI